MTSETETADDFLKISHKFKLGCLLTEQQCPHTLNLSHLAHNDLAQAIDKIKFLDANTIKTLRQKIPALSEMYVDVNDCL